MVCENAQISAYTCSTNDSSSWLKKVEHGRISIAALGKEAKVISLFSTHCAMFSQQNKVCVAHKDQT